MDDTMKDDKKKKKGVAIVIAVTPHAPKKPENTMKPDEKMEKAWAMMKDSARYRPELDEDPRTKQEIQDERGHLIDEYYDMLEGFGIRHDDDDIEPTNTKRMRNQMIIDNEKNNWPEGVERSLDDEGNILLDGKPIDEYQPEPMKKAWSVLKEDNAIETEEANRKLTELLAEVKRLREIEREWKQMWSKLEDYPDMSAELTRHIEQQENEQFYDEDIESDMDSLPPDEINEMFRQD